MNTETIIFHDESDRILGGAYRSHILLFVPSLLEQQSSTPLFGSSMISFSPLSLLFEKVKEIRKAYSLEKSKLHYTDIAGRKWNKYDIGTRMMIDCTVDAMRNKRPEHFTYPLCCKLAILAYPRNADKSAFGHPNPQERELRRNEIILRILLKGACHYLYGPDDSLRISRIITDGQPHQRPLSESRIIQQLLIDEVSGRTPLRDYVSFRDDAIILHQNSDHKLYSFGSEPYMYANMLQLTDLMGGASLRAMNPTCDIWRIPPKVGDLDVPKKNAMAYSVRSMFMKFKRGKNFKYSGHHRSFSVNKLDLHDEKIFFNQLRPEVLISSPPPLFMNED